MTTTIDVEPTQAIARREPMAVSTPMSVQEIVGQVALIQEVMKSVMKEGEHFGKIPGCGDKPALLKAGAEKLGMTFRLAPTFDVSRLDGASGHREYQVICTLNGRHQGVGTCSTMEGKYRYRTGPKKPIGKPVPKAYWDMRQSDPGKAQALLGGKGFSTMKDDTGQWVICEQGERVEHDNPADYYNTVLKMAKKRAHVDAVLTATAASDCFIQDLDEMVADGVLEAAPEAKAAPRATQTVKQAAPATTAGKPFKSKEVLIKLLSKNEEAALRVLREEGVLMPNETLADYPEDKLPINAEQMNNLLNAVQEEADGQQGSEGEPSGEYDIDPGEQPAWKSHKFHFGALKGKTLGEFAAEDSKKLYGWAKNYNPSVDRDGKPKQASADDMALRDALDECLAHMEERK